MTPDFLVTPATVTPAINDLLSPLNSAISDCAEALQTGQSPAAACQRLGDILQGLGRFQETIFWHTAALEETPNLAALYVNLGRLCIKQRRWEQATLYYEQAIQHDPTSATAYRSLGNLHAHLGQSEQALECRYQALMLRPDWATPQNQLKLGNLFLSAKQAERAIECYERSLQLQPSFQTHYNLAVTLTAQERWQEAKTAYQNALEINPDHAESYYGLCKVAEQENDLQQALIYCQQAVELSPNSFAACYTLGTLLLKLNRWENAALAYQQALELNPEFAWSHHNLGYVLLKQGRLQEAQEMLQYATQHLSESPWSYCHLAEVFNQQGQWGQASAAFLNVVQLQADLPGIYYRLGHVLRRYLETGVEAAIAEYQDSATASPEFYAETAQELKQINQLDGAYFCYRMALHLQPNRSDWYTELEQIWAAREQLQARLAELRAELAQHPEQSWLYTELGNLLSNQGEAAEARLLHRQGGILRGWQRAATREYSFAHDWFTHNIPVWTEHLQRFVNLPVNALEIGSFEGMSSCWLLDYILTHPEAKLTCIDLYFQESFGLNIAKTGSPEKIIKIAAESHQTLASLESQAYDLIYIDGNHLADHAQQDAHLSWRLLKPGGLLIFDDYEWSDANYPGQETKIGIDAFMATVQSEVEVLHRAYQLIVRKSVPANVASNVAR
ncbi:MAG: tetratricopeptide repeat protein [Pegethrix bostrychoides GSE-TBD4-15B]|jgi:tetratricopeptide (TPR) repeat protein|uniref:Tetratricopeptide repeat protein n=1 Tax=Pegethrix bostrychoides GSE-TBD4-15B TaxID=2839662 RepID=A0A951P7S5_9CYAN|nr:tetratricopeptide repeat protein [Pegethrix bostrychoides GSE-TBD4-15B]